MNNQLYQTETRVTTGYYPRDFQATLHDSLKRFNVIVCHRRFGKTVFAINEIIDQSFRCEKRDPQYAYIAPTYGQAKRVAWDLLKKYTENFPNRIVNEAELRIDIQRPWMGDRIRIFLLGAENNDAIRGIYLDGCVLDEFASMFPSTWSQVVRPTLSDRSGWAIFIGTPKGQNHFAEMYEMAGHSQNQDTWYRAIYKLSDTKLLPQSEIDEIKRTMTEEDYEQEYECSFTSLQMGAYYKKQFAKAEEDKRITRLAWDSTQTVATFWDIGIGDTTAIWFMQSIGKQYHFIDYLEMSGRGLDYFAQELLKRGYTYSAHVLPHDIMARELGTGETRLETLDKFCKEAMVTGRLYVCERQKIEDGINAVRNVFSQCFFDEVKCERGISALKNYSQAWDEKNKIFSDRPLHNWASHGADAFRTFGLGKNFVEQYSTRGRNRLQSLPPKVNNKYNVFKHGRGD